MGAAQSLTSNLTRSLFGQKEFRILMVGLDYAGKSTILDKLKLGEVTTTTPTIGFDVEYVEAKRGTTLISFHSFSVGGRDKIRPLLLHYYRHVDALVWVVDSIDRDRIEDASIALHGMLDEEELKSNPLLVFANKQDFPDAMKVEEVVCKMELNKLRNREWYIIGSSGGTTGEGLFEGLEWLSDAHKKLKSKGRLQQAEKEASHSILQNIEKPGDVK
eukprot:TRINITY_DN13850_c0_g2_i1.p1 TRINITY_DN13850_c0_g2~~TRINITY_DN13850_c0_g2_i1.p1  ORF type:complete len:217 (+),score=39.57 TRINITY_DN13850_c0_g2_i1:72-722(+)